MLSADERPDGTIKVHFVDNTYKTLPLKLDTPVSDVIEWLCKRLSTGGRVVEPSRHDLFIVAPGNQALRERRLLREDKPLQILEGERRLLRKPNGQGLGCTTAFKFVFREMVSPAADGADQSQYQSEDPDATEAVSAETLAAAQDTPPSLWVAAPVPVVVGSCARLKTGALERLDDEAGTWLACTALLDEEHFWYSLGPSALEGGGMGGGMAHIALTDVESALEVDDSKDKRAWRLQTKADNALVLRARSQAERGPWILAITRQASLLKEQGVLLKAELLVAHVEQQRSTRQQSRLDDLERLPGILDCEKARQLFLEFVRIEHESCQNNGASERASIAGKIVWPEGLSLEVLEDSLARGREEPGDAAWAFAQGPLLARFWSHPSVRCGLCRLAAGIG